MTAVFPDPPRRGSQPSARRRWSLWSLLVLLCSLGPAFADPPDPAQVEFFERHIRPVLTSHCLECHSDSIQAKGGLRLDIAMGPHLGGQRGQTLVVGKPEESLLIKALRHEGNLRMPPGNRLDDETINHFEDWIRQGAVDPRTSEPERPFAPRDIDWAGEGAHWAFQTPQAPAIPIPVDTGWAWSEIDRFIRANQETAAVRPNSDAPKATWLRRVTLDLSGLPPTPGELLDFELDNSPQARERVVDRLLDSPRFGERWARHWLDVSRYGESTGKERNFVYLQAWRYRDYVIDAFQRDLPYDQFLREQIAGDLLPHATPAERDRHQIATGFLALNPKGINDRNRESFLLEIVDEQIESISRGVLGLSVVCARCHDHKYDPVSQADYYRLAGIFRSSEPRFGILNRTRNASVPEQLLELTAEESRRGLPLPHAQIAELRLRNEALQLQQGEIRRRRDALPPPPKPTAQQVASAEVKKVVGSDGAATTASAARQSGEPASPEELAIRQLEEEAKQATKQLEELRAKVTENVSQTMAIGVIDRPQPADIHLRVKGEVDRLGTLVPRGFLQVLRTPGEPRIGSGSGRLELAQWLTSPAHPLTARVFVNRVWSKLLGRGLVPSVDNFGLMGDKPTHPELLDHLTVRFQQEGWSTKRLIRSIVLSRVYAIADSSSPDQSGVDLENRLYWRWNPKRLDAEALRDAVLAIGGGLDLHRPWGTPLLVLGTRELGPTTDYSPLQRPNRHRSIYLPFLRGQAPEMLAVFDVADPSLTVGTRDVTSGPDQALYLLNSPLALDEARFFAQRLLEIPALSSADRVDLAFKLAIGQPPSAAQRDQAIQFLADIESQHRAQAPPDAAPSELALRAWSSLSQVIFALPEFRYLF